MGFRTSVSRMQGTSAYIERKGKRSCLYYEHGTCMINGECMGGYCGDYKPDSGFNQRIVLGLYDEEDFSKNQYVKTHVTYARWKWYLKPQKKVDFVIYNNKPYFKDYKISSEKLGEGKIESFYEARNGSLNVRVVINNNKVVSFEWNTFCKNFGIDMSPKYDLLAI